MLSTKSCHSALHHNCFQSQLGSSPETYGKQTCDMHKKCNSSTDPHIHSYHHNIKFILNSRAYDDKYQNNVVISSFTPRSAPLSISCCCRLLILHAKCRWKILTAHCSNSIFFSFHDVSYKGSHISSTSGKVLGFSLFGSQKNFLLY